MCPDISGNCLIDPRDGACGPSDELEYFCHAGGAELIYNAQNNEYVNIKCEVSRNSLAES